MYWIRGHLLQNSSHLQAVKPMVFIMNMLSQLFTTGKIELSKTHSWTKIWFIQGGRRENVNFVKLYAEWQPGNIEGLKETLPVTVRKFY